MWGVECVMGGGRESERQQKYHINILITNILQIKVHILLNIKINENERRMEGKRAKESGRERKGKRVIESGRE